jgi:predicted CoA-binding protein
MNIYSILLSMTIQQIYDTYKIPKELQTHMYRVALVWSTIAHHSWLTQDTQEAIKTACLLHDMGNIIKFTFDRPIAWLSVYENPQYRQQVQQDFVKRYGPDEHHATQAIAKEIWVNNTIQELIASIGYSQIAHHLGTNNFSAKICCYADMCVTPYGIKGMEARMQEAFLRYKGKYWKNETEFHASLSLVQELEKEVFVNCNITPEELLQLPLEVKIQELQNYPINSDT